MDKENKLILYKDEEGRVSVNTRFADEDGHVGNIYQDKELSEEGTRKKFLLVRQKGKRQVRRNL